VLSNTIFKNLIPFPAKYQISNKSIMIFSQKLTGSMDLKIFRLDQKIIFP